MPQSPHPRLLITEGIIGTEGKLEGCETQGYLHYIEIMTELSVQTIFLNFKLKKKGWKWIRQSQMENLFSYRMFLEDCDL